MRAFIPFLLLASACQTQPTTVERWGTLREVLHDGQTQGRVELRQAIRAHSVGIGVIEGLEGEIAIADGETCVGRATGETTWAVERGAAPKQSAAFLALANVEHWEAVLIKHDVPADRFEDWLDRIGRERGFRGAWPFVIEGEFDELDAHVLRGACPLADPNAPEPVHAPWPSAKGKLVGLFALESGGVLTHHGQITHVHAVLDEPAPFVGHVDAVAVREGAILRVPARE